MMEKISKPEAIGRGLKLYFTGEPCKYGHVAPRCTRKSNECIECRRLGQRKHYNANANLVCSKIAEYKRANPEKVRAWSRQRWANLTAEQKAAQLQKLALWAKENRERRKEAEREANRLRRLARPAHFSNKKAQSHIRNRSTNNERTKRWKANNPERVATLNRKRRAQHAGAGGSHTPADIADIKRMQRSRCAYCPANIGSSYHVDHIKPLIRGGTNDRRNLQLLCQPCNNKKHAADPLVFARKLGMLL